MNRPFLLLSVCLIFFTSCGRIKEMLDPVNIVMDNVSNMLEITSLNKDEILLSIIKILDEEEGSMRDALKSLDTNAVEAGAEYAQVTSMEQNDGVIIFYSFNTDNAPQNTAFFAESINDCYASLLAKYAQVSFMGLNTAGEFVISYDIHHSSLFLPYMSAGVRYWSDNAEILPSSPSTYRDAYQALTASDSSRGVLSNMELVLNTVHVRIDEDTENGRLLSGFIEISGYHIPVSIFQFKEQPPYQRLRPTDRSFESLLITAYMEWEAEVNYVGLGFALFYDPYGYRVVIS